MLVINNSDATLVQCCTTIEQALYWADIICPQDDFQIIDPVVEHLKVYSDSEVVSLLKQVTGKVRKITLYNSREIREELCDALKGLPKDNSSIEYLRKTLGREIKPVVIPNFPKEQIPPKSNRCKPSVKDKVSRPKEGTTTGQVWDIADKLYSCQDLKNKQEVKSLKKSVLNECVALGINPSTVSVQLGKWKVNKTVD